MHPTWLLGVLGRWWVENECGTLPGMLQFGVSAWSTESAGAWTDMARTVEAEGFDTLLTADHVAMLDPFAALMAAAAATERIRLGTYVLNAEFWNPLLLARAVATVDLLTGGRLLVGVGAGHAQVEFEQAGIRYGSPGERTRRLEAFVPALRRLLAGETVTDHALGLRDAATGITTAQHPVPLLVGGNGDRVLSTAARTADAIGLVGFTSGTGRSHSDLSHWTWAGLEDRIGHVKQAAGGRLADLHLDLLVQLVAVTDDRAGTVGEFLGHPDLPVDMHLDSPFLLLGTEDEIAAQLERTEALGVGGVTVFQAHAALLAPVIGRLKGGTG